MACLYLMRPELDNIAVLWANTGKNYPELLRTVAQARTMCPHFIEIETDRDRQWRDHGIPSDIVPVDWTVMGQVFAGAKPVTVQSYLGCCYMNITGPLIAKAVEIGATTLISGKRSDDNHKHPSKSGSLVQGFTLIHPVEDWTAAEVLLYLSQQMGELPAHYALEHSSMDCYDCTAFAAHSTDRIRYMRERHPKFYMEFSEKLALLNEAISKPVADYTKLLAMETMQ